MSEEEAPSIYANDYYVTFRRDEFYVQLRLLNPNGRKSVLGVHLSPWIAKGLTKALQRMVVEYEKEYRPIGEPKFSRVGRESKKFVKKGFTPPVYA